MLRSSKPARFALLALALAACVALSPLGTEADVTTAYRALTTTRPVVLVGNSVIDHVSKCDGDRRTIPDLLAADLGRPVVDFSYGGQGLAEAAVFSWAALRNPRVDHVIVPVTLFELADRPHLPFPRTAFFRLIDPGLELESPREWIRMSLSDEPAVPRGESFSYGGRRYPDANGLGPTYEQVEKDHMPCPEHDGFDRTFVEAYYHHSYLGAPVRQEQLSLLAKLDREAKRRGKALTIVLLPIDYELIESLSKTMQAAVRQLSAEALAQARGHGVAMVDLTPLLPNEDFADRYCGCGHLLDSGRHRLARSIAAAVEARDRRFGSAGS